MGGWMRIGFSVGGHDKKYSGCMGGLQSMNGKPPLEMCGVKS